MHVASRIPIHFVMSLINSSGSASKSSNLHTKILLAPRSRFNLKAVLAAERHNRAMTVRLYDIRRRATSRPIDSEENAPICSRLNGSPRVAHHHQ
jgi:hypothetical protein